MTLAQIILMAINKLDEDPHDVSEFHDLFAAYANEGYRIAVEQYIKPLVTYPIHTDKNGYANIPYSNIRKVVTVYDEDKNEVMFEQSLDGKTLHTGYRDADLSMLCEITYRDMDEDSDKPRIPENLHPCLADYIAYRYLASGNLAKQQKSQIWRQQFYQVMMNSRRQGYATTTRCKNLYTQTDIRNNRH